MTNYPTDWPGDGPIDLNLHDLPHRSSAMEWWYVNSHLETVTGRNLSLFASFFRLAIERNEATGALEYAHSVTWAISDADSGKYYAASHLDPRSPELALKELERGEWSADKFLERAVSEVLVKGQVPRPDRLIDGPICIGEQVLDLDFGGQRFFKDEAGLYHLTLFNHELEVACNLTFRLLKHPIRHGDNGVVHGVSNEDMFYYFVPRCRVEGTLLLEGQSVLVKAGSGWYDHEFGLLYATEKREYPKRDAAWNWFSAQLDNGYEITAAHLFDHTNGQICDHQAIVIDPAGNSRRYQTFTLEPLNSWTSMRTFNNYPTCWQLEIPEARISLAIEAAFPDQEFITVISKPAFWEGRIQVAGMFNGQSTTGLGFVERSGFDAVETLEAFLKGVGRQTRQAIRALLPLEPTYEQARRLIASEAHDHYLAGLDLDQYARTVIKPIREIADRGGKTWRSYVLLACADVVGGDSREHTQWLAVPELLHVGSLIVDDVEDRSTIRRGGPACHQLYGEALAINAGTAAYFFGQLLAAHDNGLTEAEKLRIYDLYFETLRATHAGQAADIEGLDRLMPSVVESGDGRLLEERILAIHRLKSAVPARSLAMMGAIAGRGTPEQIDGLGHFFEQLGLAFQIIDDMLNLRGFKDNLKSRGEDIAQGKVTMPIAKAMSRLSLRERRWLWKTLSAKPGEPEIIAAVIDQLENCCALTTCEQQARHLVETAWGRLDPLLPESFVKLKLRAFSWFVLERHY